MYNKSWLQNDDGVPPVCTTELSLSWFQFNGLLLFKVTWWHVFNFTAHQMTEEKVTVVVGRSAILPCKLTDTQESLDQISWQRRTKEQGRDVNFLTIQDQNKVQFVDKPEPRFKFIGDFSNKDGTLKLSDVSLEDEATYTCIFSLFPSGYDRREISLHVLGMMKPFFSLFFPVVMVCFVLHAYTFYNSHSTSIHKPRVCNAYIRRQRSHPCNLHSCCLQAACRAAMGRRYSGRKSQRDSQ